jgi:hypothetical protein
MNKVQIPSTENRPSRTGTQAGQMSAGLASRPRGGKCEGRKSHAEKRPEVVAEAKRLRRASPTTGERRSRGSVASWRPRATSTSAVIGHWRHTP